MEISTITTVLGFIGVIFLLAGAFLILTGSGIIELHIIIVEKSKKTLLAGIILGFFGGGMIFFEQTSPFSFREKTTSRINESTSSTITPEESQILLPQPELNAIQTIHERDFTFNLQGCVHAKDKKVTCTFWITSNDSDKRLAIYSSGGSNSSRIFDNSGYEYYGSHVTLADKSDSKGISTILIADVPVKAIVTFNGVSPEAKFITRFDFGCYDYLKKRIFTIQFRNVPLTKE